MLLHLLENRIFYLFIYYFSYFRQMVDKEHSVHIKEAAYLVYRSNCNVALTIEDKQAQEVCFYVRTSIDSWKSLYLY